MKLVGIALVTLVVASCGSHDRAEVKRDPERQRRVIEPPSGRVRPLPPHAIRADGVGPYKLRASLAELIEQLPSGPRVATLDLPGVVHRSVLRGEDDAILIGGEPLGKASSIAVIGSDVAKTESGIHVGSTREEMIRALGAPELELERARDPRVIAPSNLRNLRAVFDGDRIVALVVTDVEPTRSSIGLDAGVPDGQCVRPATDDPSRFGTCMAAGEVVAIDGDDLSVRAPETDRVLALARVPGLVFAAPLRNDGRDELVAISRIDDPQQRSWSLVVFRFDGGRLVRVGEPSPLYQLTAASARWIGADLRDIELYLELTSRSDAIEVGGLLTTRIGDKLRDVVMISPVLVPRRRAKSAPIEAVDAGAADAAAPRSSERPRD